MTFARYTGQAERNFRQALTENPPDILLTNCVMLELLSRGVWDRNLLGSADKLKYVACTSHLGPRCVATLHEWIAAGSGALAGTTHLMAQWKPRSGAFTEPKGGTGIASSLGLFGAPVGPGPWSSASYGRDRHGNGGDSQNAGHPGEISGLTGESRRFIGEHLVRRGCLLGCTKSLGLKYGQRGLLIARLLRGDEALNQHFLR